ncbi:HNH endonuclease [Nocardia puris]|uniref:HNH endonuclease n=1 Tax=Nocardia puris TaxID=208602 RepID=UPI0009FCE1AB
MRDRERCRLRFKGCFVHATEVDHKVNRRSGGSDALENLQAVCSHCHRRKTHLESRAAWRVNRRAGIHRDHKRKHPGLR